MIIYTGRFQPFHNGHLSFIKKLKKIYPNEKICVAIIKDVPLVNKTKFDDVVDGMLKKQRNPFNAETTLSLVTKSLQQEGEENLDVLVTLMPRASEETWPYIVSMFDCERTWVFTKNQEKFDAWEEEKFKFYKSLGENIVQIPISNKEIGGTDIRKHIEADEFDKIINLVPKCVYDYFVQNYNSQNQPY